MIAATTNDAESMDTTSESTFFYHPPSGGDISLRSSDGTVFLAHSLLLRLGSSVFADMFSTATQSDVIELSDDAESISLMLRFIYPPVFMDSLSTALLEKSLCIAQKYDVSGITTAVDHILVTQSPNQDSLFRSEPIRAFCLAAKYGLPKTQKVIEEAIRPGHHVFCDPKEIKWLANAHPNSARLISLLGAHCMQAKLLSELLLGDRRWTIFPNVTAERCSDGQIMMCRRCFEDRGHEYGEETNYAPSWFIQWTITAFLSLTSRPLAECNYLFEGSILGSISEDAGICHDCLSAAHAALDGIMFRVWARKVKAKIWSVIKDVECLYEL
ncbi:hypothetical protein FRC07_008363 [Ceratobasidium sp. 392]|nr:hypothetical protein FRC07_008363 [Ceratobasidium sp. 392]